MEKVYTVIMANDDGIYTPMVFHNEIFARDYMHRSFMSILRDCDDLGYSEPLESANIVYSHLLDTYGEGTIMNPTGNENSPIKWWSLNKDCFAIKINDKTYNCEIFEIHTSRRRSDDRT